MGLFQVFMKEWLGYRLDDMKSALVESAVLRLQRYVRGFLTRKRYRSVKSASIVVQAVLRAWIIR